MKLEIKNKISFNKKIRYLIGAVKQLIIVYIDCSAAGYIIL